MDLKLCESDFRFMCIVWDYEPLTSRNLVDKCSEILGWKKSTTYTVLKKLCDKGFTVNDNSVVTSLVDKSAVQQYSSNSFINGSFGGSLPNFLVAFLGGKKISNDEAEELKKLIDEYKEN